jgi:hypothetical protein
MLPCVLATVAVAVTVEPFRPNETLFEFENTKAEARLLVVPALRLMLPCVLATVAVAVTVDPFRPNETLFEFESVTAERLFEVVPAETLMFESNVPPAFGRKTVALPVATPTSCRSPAVLLKPIDALDPTDVFPISKSAPT